jgi:hypothetical protein
MTKEKLKIWLGSPEGKVALQKIREKAIELKLDIAVIK